MTAFNNFVTTFISVDFYDFNLYIFLLVIFFVLMIYFACMGSSEITIFDNFLNNILFIIILVCILFIIVIFILSVANFFIVLYFIIIDFFNTFFNDNLIIKETNHYKLINLLKCTNKSYSNDNLFIFINEYMIISMTQILYFIVGIILVYLLVIIIIFIYYNLVIGENYQFSFGIDLTFIYIGLFIFLFSIIQISFFTIFFNTYIMNIYQDISDTNVSIDKFIHDNLPDKSQKGLYDIIYKDKNDTSLINNYIKSSIILEKDLLLYDLYIYINTYIGSSDSNYELIGNYLLNKNNDISFYDLINANIILPIQKYHEKLDIYNKDSNTSSSLDRIDAAIETLNTNIEKINSYIIKNNNATKLPIYYILLYCFFMILLMFFTIFGIMYIIINAKTEFFNNIFNIKYVKIFLQFCISKLPFVKI